MTVNNPVPDRLEPRPWRPIATPWGELAIPLDRYVVRAYSDWLEVLVRIVGREIVEAALRLVGYGTLTEHWVADGVQPQINMEEA